MTPLHDQPTPCRHVVAMPYPGRGHINPMLSLCAAVADRSSDVRITVVLTEEWLGLLASEKKPPNVAFATIPNVVPPEKARGDDLPAFVAAVLTKMQTPFEQLLDGGSLPPPDFIIGDAFMSWIHEVAGKRNIPSAHLWTMSAAVYTVFYHFDLLVQNGHYPVDLSANGDAVVDYIPGLPPVCVADLPLIVREQESMPKLIQILPKDSNAKHLIFTSFHELEAQVIDALKQKSSLSIYTIGPAAVYYRLRDIKMSSSTTTTTTNDYLRWLDHQPPSSVLYISLGSFLHIPAAQMEEIAAGLQGSGVRFLWVARREASRLQAMSGDKGLVVEWCDQLRVLGHPSVGGFLSHCGWNSTKEAILASVPVLTFPLMMDQLSDAKAIVQDWRVGWRFLEREFDERDLKKRDEIAGIVKRFMDLESATREELTRNARELQKICEREFEDGGSHQTNLDHLVRSIKS
ncbi:UDP-glycosyltransferase 87A2-like [Salvia miltiorrhiza]|uniref:UDP-glycosyltransferase 87A2-like n=1 Tax=Salvia miltiorrhiza TaxID=226208 RepID=UPI0025AC45EC|nr:UDP-glycosyltransferase 87A2-like [Salvia miltiorrhiza]